MTEAQKTRVAVNGYGVIGKRVAAAVVRQADMQLAGVSDVVTDWRARVVTRNGFSLFGATTAHADAMRAAGLDVTGTLDELLGQPMSSSTARRSASPRRTSKCIATAV
jgi:glyceraldehyde-3-phosphate dehydrogenase (NAD(P))